MVFEDDDDEPVDPYKPPTAKSIVKSEPKKSDIIEVEPALVEVKPNVPDDLLAARKRMISTRLVCVYMI